MVSVHFGLPLFEPSSILCGGRNAAIQYTLDNSIKEIGPAVYKQFTCATIECISYIQYIIICELDSPTAERGTHLIPKIEDIKNIYRER